jgi:hypothetical protein
MTGSPKMPADYFAEFPVPTGWNYVDGMVNTTSISRCSRATPSR